MSNVSTGTGLLVTAESAVIRLCACTNFVQWIYITTVRTSAEERVYVEDRVFVASLQ